MASNWRAIVPNRPNNDDKLPLWQRRSSRRTPPVVPESGSESGGLTTSSASRSSSTDDDRLDTLYLMAPVSRTVQQLSPIFANRLGVTRFNNDRSPTMSPATSSNVGRSSSFRETGGGGASYPSTPGSMGGGGGSYRRNGSPYNASSRYPPMGNSNRGMSTSGGDHLTADYVPSWRPDRRFSTPAVPRSRGSRSPSPRFIGGGGSKKGSHQFEYFRSRAASLPASNGSLNVPPSTPGGNSTRRRKQPNSSDNWPQTRSPSRVEQRFLQLSESADYDKLRTFVIGAKGELVERGFCYRHRSETGSSSSGGSTGPTASPNEDAAKSSSNNTETMDNKNNESFAARPVPRYQILVIGAQSVGKSSLLSLLKKSQEFRCDEIPNLSSVDSGDPGMAIVLPVLICGEEVHLEFYEFCAAEEHLWSSIQWQAAIVVYSISDKRSFSAAADALYQIRAQRGMNKDGGVSNNLPIPIVLVANKIDLERQRQVQDSEGTELAKSYDCRFVDVSVELTHHVEDLLSTMMNEIWRYTVSSYRQRHMQSLSGQSSIFDEDPAAFSPAAVPADESKPKRFSFRRASKYQPKSSPSKTVNGGGGGQPRSSRARSLYTLPPGLPAAIAAVHSGSPHLNHHHHHRGGGGSGFLSRLLGRRAVQSCEDLFSRLLRG